MKKPSRTDVLVLAVILIPVIVAMFLLGRNSVKPIEHIEQPDFGPYIRKIDSIKKLKLDADNRIRSLEKVVDSLKSAKTNNHKNLNHNVDKIKNFTPDSRNRWNDSILKLEGIRPNNVSPK